MNNGKYNSIQEIICLAKCVIYFQELTEFCNERINLQIYRDGDTAGSNHKTENFSYSDNLAKQPEH